MKSEKIFFGKAIDLTTENHYFLRTKEMIIESRKIDPTIVLHSDDEIVSRYKHSIIGLLNGEIVSNISVYPTKMKPLDKLIIDNEEICVGEIGSSIVDLQCRTKGIGSKMSDHLLSEFSGFYKAFVSATINPIMVRIRIKKGFIPVSFPNEYFEQGKKYLAPFLSGGEEEFVNKATCLMKFNIEDNSINKQIVELLKNQSQLPPNYGLVSEDLLSLLLN